MASPSFSSSAQLTYGTGSFYALRGHPVHYQALRSAPSLHPPDASTTFHPESWQPKLSPRVARGPPGVQNCPRLRTTGFDQSFIGDSIGPHLEHSYLFGRDEPVWEDAGGRCVNSGEHNKRLAVDVWEGPQALNLLHPNNDPKAVGNPTDKCRVSSWRQICPRVFHLHQSRRGRWVEEQGSGPTYMPHFP